MIVHFILRKLLLQFRLSLWGGSDTSLNALKLNAFLALNSALFVVERSLVKCLISEIIKEGVYKPGNRKLL